MPTKSAKKRARRQAAADAALQAAETVGFGGHCQVLAAVREMAQEDVLAAIPQATLDAVRAEDPHPLFVALDIAHEGESTGDMVVNGQNVGKQRKLWGAGAIRDWVSKAKTSIVKGVARLWHGKSHEDKREVGRPLAAFLKDVGGKLHAVLVGWIHHPEAKADFAAGKITTGSMEADALFERQGDSWLVRAVQAVQGALLVGQGVKPGFPGATVLASVQELDTDEEDKTMPNEPLTLRDVQDFIRENGLDPSKVFGKEALLSDRVVADALAAEVDAKVAEAKGELQKQLDDLTPDAEAYRKDQVNKAVGELVANSEKLKDVTKGLAAFVIKRVQLDLSEVPEEGRQAKVDEAVQRELDFVKEFDLKVPEPDDGNGDKGGGDDDPDKGGGAGKQKDKKPGAHRTTIGGIPGVTLVGGKDFTDPKVNPQIPR